MYPKRVGGRPTAARLPFVSKYVMHLIFIVIMFRCMWSHFHLVVILILMLFLGVYYIITTDISQVTLLTCGHEDLNLERNKVCFVHLVMAAEGLFGAMENP